MAGLGAFSFGSGGDTGSRSATASGSPGTDATLIGWHKTSPLSNRGGYTPVYMVNPSAQAPVTNNNTYLTNKTDVATPITTQTTTGVSPVLNVAAGNQGGGTTQGASTQQDTTPTSNNQLPQGGSTVGLSNEQITAMLEQQRRESDVIAAERLASATREADLRGQLATQQAIQQMQADYAARETATRSQAQMQPLSVTQDAPVPLPVTAPVLKAPDALAVSVQPVPVPALQPGNNGVKPVYLFAALALGALFLSQGGKNGNKKSKR